MAGSGKAFDYRYEAETAAALFPALLVEAERIAQTVSAGVHGRRRAGPGETFWQHRPYVFGDPVSAIDWRQSARMADRLYVRQNEWEAPAAVLIWRDPSRSLNFTSDAAAPTKARRADILATALTILLADGGERIGLIGGETRMAQGKTAPARILEALLAIEGEETDWRPGPAAAPPGARVVFLSDFYTDADTLRAAVAHFANAGAVGVLMQICDPAEEDFPFAGRVEFRDLESRDRMIFGDAADVGARYREQFAAHRDMIAAIAAGAGWSFVSHRTDRPPQTALMALYMAVGDPSRLGG